LVGCTTFNFAKKKKIWLTLKKLFWKFCATLKWLLSSCAQNNSAHWKFMSQDLYRLFIIGSSNTNVEIFSIVIALTYLPDTSKKQPSILSLFFVLPHLIFE
jgi:hypothetical protein